MSASSFPDNPSLLRRVEEVCDRFEAAWKAAGSLDQRPKIEDYLGEIREPERSLFLRELLELEIAYRRLAGKELLPEQFRQRFPENAALIASVFEPAQSDQDGQASPSTISVPLQAGETLSRQALDRKVLAEA